MLGTGASGIGLAAMSVTETGVDAERDRASGPDLAKLLDHVGRAEITEQIVLLHGSERVAVEQVGGVDDFRRIHTASKAGSKSSSHFTGADGVDDCALLADPIEHGEIRVGFLGVANHIEGTEIFDSSLDDIQVVDVSRRAELFGQVATGDSGDFRANGGEVERAGHGQKRCSKRKGKAP